MSNKKELISTFFPEMTRMLASMVRTTKGSILGIHSPNGKMQKKQTDG